MLTVKIDLVPGGFSPLRRTIATMRIGNASDLADVSDYVVEAMESANPLTGNPRRSAQAMVIAHDRRQSVLKLVERACQEILRADYRSNSPTN